MHKPNHIKVVTEPLELQYVSYGESLNGAMRYTLTMIIPPSLDKTIKAINSAVEELKPKGKNAKGGLRLCSDYGRDEYPDDYYFLVANSVERPGCVDTEFNPIEFDQFTPGCIARVSFTIYPYSVNKSHGVAAGINNMMLIKAGPPRVSSAAEDFMEK